MIRLDFYTKKSQKLYMCRNSTMFFGVFGVITHHLGIELRACFPLGCGHVLGHLAACQAILGVPVNRDGSRVLLTFIVSSCTERPLLSRLYLETLASANGSRAARPWLGARLLLGPQLRAP